MRLNWIGFLTVSFLAAACWPAPAESPAELAPVTLIKAKTERIMTILREKDVQNPDALPKLRRRLIEELEPVFAFREMAVRALGVHARQQKPEQIDALGKSFKKLLERVYIDQLTAHLAKADNPYSVEEIRVTEYEIRGNYARVSSRARIRKNSEMTEIVMNYRMVKREGPWMIYDVEIEGVSLIENYRTQFNEILVNHPFDYLLQMIDKNVETLVQEQPMAPKEKNSKTQSKAGNRQ